MPDMFIEKTLLHSARVKQNTAQSCSDSAEQAAQMIAETLQKGGKLMLCGNGGSAADCQHLATEFVACLDHNRPRAAMAAIALTTDSSLLTAYSNDFGFAGIFMRQIEALGQAGDLLLAFSTSGDSENIIKAAITAIQTGIKVIGLTGKTGGALADHCDLLIAVPSDITMHIQECHIALGHAITARVEQLMKQK